MPWPRAVASLCVAAQSALIVVGLVGVWVAPSRGSIGWLALAAVAAVGCLAVGLLVARQAGDNPVAALLPLVGVALLGVAATDVYWRAAQLHPDRLTTLAMLTSLGVGGWVWLYIPLALLALCFPDGKLLSRRWWPVVAGLLLIGTAYPYLSAIDPDPYPSPYQDQPHALGTGPDWVTTASAALALSLFPLLVVSAASLWVRYRRSEGRARAQILWLSLAGMGLPLTLLLCWASYLLLGGADLVVVGLGLTCLAVPAATAVAMFRHDLYDLDRTVSQTVVWSLVLVALLSLFSLVTVVGGLAVGGRSSVVAALATAACALVLAPLRRRLTREVERRRHPQQVRVLAALRDLSRKVHAGQADPAAVQDLLRSEVDDPGLWVAIRLPRSDDLVGIDSHPLPDAATSARLVPVRLGTEDIGAIHTLSAAPGLPEIADACALLVELVRLRMDLAWALEEVSSSRTRLLQAGYEERRRLERDLHDGAQQRLVTSDCRAGSRSDATRPTAPRLRPVGSTMVSDPLDELFDATVAELATAVQELRQIAHGLRPSSLDDGLGPALANLTSRLSVDPGLRVHLDVSPTLQATTLPDDVATTAYFIANESVTNAVKHADAAVLSLRADQVDSTLRLRISDDGCGGAVPRPGSGLAGLSDRVAALGGVLVLDSPVGGPTVVEAVLPCA